MIVDAYHMYIIITNTGNIIESIYRK